ncbi:hypothetical protein ACQP00_51065 [Dactylosporangium sp. CS-047395]|uniref:hypothetical protein n=1 Tax=Dactylosporangium sp. CS-047395 TaxID=3239936 RepID=UPI003D8D6A67
MTRGRFTVLVLAVALVLVLSGSAARHFGTEDGSCSARLPQRLGNPIPVQDGLAVAELGTSRVGASAFSVGALVANRSPTWAAYRTSMSVRLLDASGGVVADLPSSTLPMVLPGAALPVGATIGVPPDRVPLVARAEVVLSTTHWVTVEPENRLFQRFDGVPESDGDFLLPANMGEVQCSGLSATGAVLVYRDASGRVVGGESVLYSGEYCAGSHFGESLSPRNVPETADPPRTTMAVYCDVGG